MKDTKMLRLLAGPALTVVLGLILLLSPDSASALVGRILGWVAVFIALAEAFGGGKRSAVKAVIFGIIGVLILRDPLYVAKFLGRVLGLALFMWGFGGISRARRVRGQLSVTPGTVLSGAAVIIGLVLFFVPMTTSRLVLSGIGILMIGIGVAEGYDRLRDKKQLEEGSDPNIIDVEKL